MNAMRLSAPLVEVWRTSAPAADDPQRPLPSLLLGLTVVTGLVDEACLVAASVGSPPPPAIRGSGVTRYLPIVLLGVATGTQNTAARKLAVPDLTTTVLTITGIFADGRLA